MESPIMHRTVVCFLLLSLLCAASTHAAEPGLGPVVEGYGPAFAVPADSFNLDRDQHYKVVMDVGQGPDDPAGLNRGIESAARFLNLHARNGIEPAQLEMAVVLHGAAARAALSDEAHRKHYDVPNGSRGLVEALGKAGVPIYLCGQTAAYHGYMPEDLLPQVSLAVSAMTVHVRLQQEGYRAILF
jgi:intracellular sulfur oxidation DsrE/DsrF family protein